MSRKFITTVLAAAVAVTGLGSAPAKADDRDIMRFIAGAVTIGIIANAINDHGQNRVERRETRNDGYGHNNGYNNGYNGHIQPRPLPPRVSKQSLPRECRINVSTRNGTEAYYGTRCLNGNMRNVNSLPRQCEVVLRQTKGGPRPAYNANCLDRFGYRTARR